jgi:LysM repeat protein
MAAARPDLSAAAGTCYRNRPVAPRAPRRTSLGLALAALLSAAVAGAQQAPISHTVQDGETLSQIAQRYHVSTASLASRNHLDAPYALRGKSKKPTPEIKKLSTMTASELFTTARVVAQPTPSLPPAWSARTSPTPRGSPPRRRRTWRPR